MAVFQQFKIPTNYVSFAIDIRTEGYNKLVRFVGSF